MSKETRDAAAEERPSYKHTLNLLQTGFGMRANAVQREPELQGFWKDHGIDGDLGLNNSGPTFTLHDGPPYANGALHMGHALKAVRELRCGTVNINEVPGYRIECSPFGGIKDSGLGIKEGVIEAMKCLSTVKTFSLPWG